MRLALRGVQQLDGRPEESVEDSIKAALQAKGAAMGRNGIVLSIVLTVVVMLIPGK